MKTKSQLEALTKGQLDAYGKETFGVDLDCRRTKDALIEELMALRAEAEESAKVADPGTSDPKPVGKSAPKGMVTVTVTKSLDSDGADVYCNGTCYSLPINEPITIPEWVLPALKAVPGVQFTKE